MGRQSPLLLVLLILLVSACSTEQSGQRSRDDQCVVLLHGLARSSLSMDRLQWFLESSGYRVANVDYPSRDHDIETLATLAVEEGQDQCNASGGSEKMHFVTHSLGGILVRQYYADAAHDNVGRVVMLAPPNQGSQAVDAMRDWPGFEWLNGPAGFQLGKGAQSVPLQLGEPGFEFAVIAGDQTIDPVTSAVLDDPDDGRVSVSDTRLEGMAAFRVVNASHAFIMQKDEVFDLVIAFLETGRFPPEGEGVAGQ